MTKATWAFDILILHYNNYGLQPTFRNLHYTILFRITQWNVLCVSMKKMHEEKVNMSLHSDIKSPCIVSCRSCIHLFGVKLICEVHAESPEPLQDPLTNNKSLADHLPQWGTRFVKLPSISSGTLQGAKAKGQRERERGPLLNNQPICSRHLIN